MARRYKDKPSRWVDSRADDKGPEPEGIVAGKVTLLPSLPASQPPSSYLPAGGSLKVNGQQCVLLAC